jgi:lysozyme
VDLALQLKRDEAVKLKPYRDTSGQTGFEGRKGKLTIGVGRNLDDVGLSRDEVDYLLANDIYRVQMEMNKLLPWLGTVDEVRRAVLYNMAFNMGCAGVLNFHKMLAAMEKGDWMGAAREMLASKWMVDVGDRAIRLANQMRSGLWV